MKLDPAERESDPNLLTNSLDYLLGDITRKVLIGIKKFTEESITLYLTSPFRQMPRPPLTRVSRSKVLNTPERTSVDPDPTGTCTTGSRPIRVGTLLIRENAAQDAITHTETSTQCCPHWKVGDLVWVEEGTEPGVRGYRAEKYKGIIEDVAPGTSSFVIKPVLGGKSRTEFSPHLTKASMSGFAELSGRGSSQRLPISVTKTINSAEKSRAAAEEKLVRETQRREAAEKKATKEKNIAASAKSAAKYAQAERDSIMRGDASLGHFTKKGRVIVAALVKESGKKVRQLSSDLEVAQKRIKSQVVQIEVLKDDKDKAVVSKRSLAAARRADKARIEALEFQVAELPKVLSVLDKQNKVVRRLSGELMKASEGMQLLNSLPSLGRQSGKYGRPYSEQLDQQIYCLLATGASARCARDHLRLNIAFFLPGFKKQQASSKEVVKYLMQST